jgi:hypothetical protein
MSGNDPKGRYPQHSVSAPKSPEDPHDFCKQLIGNGVLNNSPDIFFTHNITTNKSPGVKSTSLKSTTALFKVKP